MLTLRSDLLSSKAERLARAPRRFAKCLAAVKESGLGSRALDLMVLRGCCPDENCLAARMCPLYRLEPLDLPYIVVRLTSVPLRCLDGVWRIEKAGARVVGSLPRVNSKDTRNEKRVARARVSTGDICPTRHTSFH